MAIFFSPPPIQLWFKECSPKLSNSEKQSGWKKRQEQQQRQKTGTKNKKATESKRSVQQINKHGQSNELWWFSSSFLWHGFKTFFSVRVLCVCLLHDYFFLRDELLTTDQLESHFNCAVILCMLSQWFSALLKIVSLTKKRFFIDGTTVWTCKNKKKADRRK